jgi:plasmid stabilization system protein ParE
MKLVVTEHAWSSLANLTDYWSTFRAADRIDEQVDALWSQVDWLLQHPMAGQFEDQLHDLGLGHRRWVFGELKIVYRIAEDELIVTDFFDSRQDPRRMKV